MAEFHLKVSKNKMSVWMTVSADDPEEEVSPEAIRDYLSQNEVVKGILGDAILELAERKRWNQEILVAEGKLPIPGQDGEIVFYFDTEGKLSPKVLENGSVDFHDLKIVHNVVTGQQLAKVIPPTDGVPGFDVLGMALPAERGKDTSLRAGINTSFADPEDTVLQADYDGHVKLKPGFEVMVDTVFRVAEDVDYSTGDIDVNGDLIVEKDVRSGFRIKATGSVLVCGTVEDAYIEAGGDVQVKGGFIGSGKGAIYAEGNVILRFIHNQRVVAGLNIHIGEEALHADLKAGAALIISSGHGSLIGGQAEAKTYAEICYVGNPKGVYSSLTVARTEFIDQKMDNLLFRLSEAEGLLVSVIDKLAGISNQIFHSGWTEDLRIQYRRHENRMAVLNTGIMELNEQVDALKLELDDYTRESFIKVTRKTYPGTRLKIGAGMLKLDAEVGPSLFHSVRGEIVTGNLR